MVFLVIFFFFHFVVLFFKNFIYSCTKIECEIINEVSLRV